MGSVGIEEEITVLVTGFGPFRDEYPINPSWEIAKLLPPFLPPPSKEDATADCSFVVNHPPVRILCHPEPVRVAYKTVRQLVPELWEHHGTKIDYMIHIGMASGRRFYSVERRGHRDGYTIKDLDGNYLDRNAAESPSSYWHGLPEEILSDVDITDVWRRWRIALPNSDVRISEDAGRYLCDFIFYSSLAYLYRKKEEQRVVFLHVPVAATAVAVENGVKITLELIRSIVQSGRLAKLLAGGQASE